MLSSSASSDASASRNCSRPRNSLFWLRSTSHRTHTLITEKYLPQNARNTRNLLAEKYLPQMRTDAHRLGGYGILPYPRSLRNPVVSARLYRLSEQELHQQNKQGYRPQNAQNTRNLLAEKHLPQNARNAQNLLAEKHLPQIARINTDVGGYGILPYPRSQQHPQTSVNSVNSVGELTQPTICVDL